MTIAQFLLQLAENPDLLEAYRSDPDGFIDASADLTDGQKMVLKSRNPLRIQHVMEYELGVKFREAGVLMGHVLSGPPELLNPPDEPA